MSISLTSPLVAAHRDATDDRSAAASPIAEDPSVPVPSKARRPSLTPTLVVCSLIVLVFLLISIAGRAITPYDPDAVSLMDKYLPPSPDHLLGTDSLGRDTLSRLIVGGRSSFLTAAIIVGISVAVGVPLGLLCAKVGGWFDALVMRVYDLILAFPALLLAIVFVAAFGLGGVTGAVAIGITYIPMISRLTRSLAMVEINKPYVQALRAEGYGDVRILAREVLPNIAPTLLSELTIDFGYAISAMASLSFLGLGVQPPQADWGTMIQEGVTVIQLNPILALVPTVAVVIVVVALNLINDEVQARVDATETPLPRAIRRESHARRLARERHASPAHQNGPTNADPSDTDDDDTTLLRVNDLSVSFLSSNGANTVVRHASFDVPRGRIVGIVGESGSGKSTLLRAILRLHDERRTAYDGTVAFHGEDILTLDEPRLRELRGSRIAMIFQNPQATLDPLLTIGRQLEEQIRLKEGLDAKAAKARAIALLEELQVTPAEQRADQYPHELSGGQLQRVAIALALVGDPELLLADEPTTALDVTAQAQVLSILRGLRASHGISVIIVTHNFGVVAEICDEVHVLHHGQIVEDAKVRDLFDHPKDAYTRHLLDASRYVQVEHHDGDKDETTTNVADGDPIVAIDGLSKTYRRAVDGTTAHAVDDVSLKVERGSIFALVGESGSGKTTIGKCVLKFTDPTDGSLTFNGTSIPSISSRRDLLSYRRHVQMVFQNPYESFNPRKRLRRTFEQYAAFLGLGKDEARAAIREKLAMAALDESILDHVPAELSGGQLQRLAIARALLSNPEFIFADEPVSALDVSVQGQVLELLRRLNREQHLTILLVSHDLGVVETICDTIAVMEKGHIVEQGPARTVFHHPRHPYTQRLLASRPKNRPDEAPHAATGAVRKGTAASSRKTTNADDIGRAAIDGHTTSTAKETTA